MHRRYLTILSSLMVLIIIGIASAFLLRDPSYDKKGDLVQNDETAVLNEPGFQRTTAEDSSNVTTVQANSTENTKSTFDNPDETQLESTQRTEKENRGVAGESEAVKALRAIYMYASSESLYPKAFDMLDENFIARLSILEQFGVAELRKSDLELDCFPIYASLFKAAKIGNILSEQSSDDITTIYFNQVFATEESDEVMTQPIVVKMKKSGQQLKVLELFDGNPNEPPFKQ